MDKNISLRSKHHPILWKIDADSVRLVYRNSRAPTFLLLLCAIASGWLLKDTADISLLLTWVLLTASLAAARLLAEHVFERATVSGQASPFWRYLLLAGACASGVMLSSFAIVFISAEAFTQQLLLLGLLSLVAASTSIAFAVSLSLFVWYVVCAFLPIVVVYLSSDLAVLQSLGLLVLMCLAAITVAVIQVNRLLVQSAEQQVHNLELIHGLKNAQQQTQTLNTELTKEIAQTQVIEHELLAVQAGLEQRVSEHTAALKTTLLNLETTQERLELALDASQLALWDWNLETDEVHHTRTQSIFGLEGDQVRDVLNDLRPLMHPEDLPVLRSAMIEHMKQRTKSYVVEYRIKHNAGHWVWIEDRGRLWSAMLRGVSCACSAPAVIYPYVNSKMKNCVWHRVCLMPAPKASLLLILRAVF